MGLPLFVAPVESDLPSKAADKNGATSPPSRSGIRRPRPDSRDRRLAMRRHMTIRDRLTHAPLRQSSTLSSRGIESHFPIPQDTSALGRSRPFREVLREMVRSDDRSRERFEEQLHSLFTGTPLQERDAGDNNPEAALDLWTVDPQTQLERDRLLGIDTRLDNIESWPRSRQRVPPSSSQPTLHRPYPGIEGLVRLSRTETQTETQTRTPMSELDSAENRRNANLWRVRGVDGLGDRERSLSPEGWDTLLTTLTPDPQPPSVGSSFASTVASQSAGASSSTSLTAPQTAEGLAADQACESGCENSDTEGPDYEHPDYARIRRRREAMRRVRVRVPDYNLDGPVDGPVDGPTDGPFSRRGALSAESSSSRLRRARDSRPPIQRDTANRPTADTSSVGGLTLTSLGGARHAWIGHFSVGTSDDERGAERRRLNRESSATSGNNTSPGEEDWSGMSGMQRIVRSLARREDIPDEWWAEAGLSRTLPQDGTD